MAAPARRAAAAAAAFRSRAATFSFLSRASRSPTSPLSAFLFLLRNPYHGHRCVAPRRDLSTAAIGSKISPFSSPALDWANGGLYTKMAIGGLRWHGWRDGRPKGQLWREKKLIGKEALFVIQGLKLYRNDEERLAAFVKVHVKRLLKADKIAVLIELERQEEVDLALKIFKLVQKEHWYSPDMYLYKDLLIPLAKCKKMDKVMQIWEDMKMANLIPDAETHVCVIDAFLACGSLSHAIEIYEELLSSRIPPQESTFATLLKSFLGHPSMRNRVKEDFELLFPDKNIYNPVPEMCAHS